MDANPEETKKDRRQRNVWLKLPSTTDREKFAGRSTSHNYEAEFFGLRWERNAKCADISK